VKVLPDSFDPIVIGTVRRQEVEFDSPFQGAQGDPGDALVLQNAPVSSPGTVSIDLISEEGAGDYTLDVVWNATLEAEAFAGATANDTVASAQSLTGSVLPLQAGANRLGLVGASGTDADVFSFSLAVGQYATLALNADLTQPSATSIDDGDSIPQAVAVGDIDGDGSQDIVSAGAAGGEDALAVILGRGDGTFDPPLLVPLDHAPGAVALGYIDGDDHLDLAVAFPGYDYTFGQLPLGQVSVFLGAGDGTFTSSAEVFVDGRPSSLALGDMDGDGHTDLVTGNYGYQAIDNRDGSSHAGAPSVSVLLGQGNGTFAAPIQQAALQGEPVAIAVARLDGDADLDVVTADSGVDAANGPFHSLSVFAGNGDGTLVPQASFDTGVHPEALQLGHIDGDGWLDAVVAGEGVGGLATGIAVLRGQGDGTFAAPTGFSTPLGPSALDLGDTNGDGHLDVLVAHGNTAGSDRNLLSVLFGSGDGQPKPQW
jgi:hypothetical protein